VLITVTDASILYFQAVNTSSSFASNVPICVRRHKVTARIFEVMLANGRMYLRALKMINMATTRSFEVMLAKAGTQ
jgi:hypothetical protein